MIPLNCMFFAMIEEFFMRFAYTTKSPFRHSEFCRTIQSDPIPEDWTANVCFGGKERNILFITASKSVYTLKMHVRGVTP